MEKSCKDGGSWGRRRKRGSGKRKVEEAEGKKVRGNGEMHDYYGFFFYVLYSTLPPLRFRCVGGCWDRTQDCCDFGIGS